MGEGQRGDERFDHQGETRFDGRQSSAVGFTYTILQMYCTGQQDPDHWMDSMKTSQHDRRPEIDSALQPPRGPC